MGIFSKKSGAKTILLLSLESGCVRGGVAFVEAGRAPALAYTASVEIPFQENLEFERLVAGLSAALSAACEKIVREGLPHIAGRKFKTPRFDEIHIFYGSPWYVSQTRTIAKKNDRPFVLSRSVLEGMVRAEVEALAREYAARQNSPDVPVIIEQNVVDVRLNGYSVSEPYGKEAREISLALFVSVMSEALRTSVEEILSRHVRAREVSHRTLASALFSAARGLSKEENALALDASAEVTDVSAVRGGVITDAISFPTGTASIVRAVSKECNVLPAEAAAFLESPHRESRAENMRGACDVAFAKMYSAWRGEFEAALGRLPAGELIPHQVFLLADPLHADFLAAAVREEDFGSTRTLKPFSVTVLTPQILRQFCTLGGGAARGDATLMLAAMYAAKL